jgi:hypothetical protein
MHFTYLDIALLDRVVRRRLSVLVGHVDGPQPAQPMASDVRAEHKTCLKM